MELILLSFVIMRVIHLTFSSESLGCLQMSQLMNAFNKASITLHANRIKRLIPMFLISFRLLDVCVPTSNNNYSTIKAL